MFYPIPPGKPPWSPSSAPATDGFCTSSGAAWLRGSSPAPWDAAADFFAPKNGRFMGMSWWFNGNYHLLMQNFPVYWRVWISCDFNGSRILQGCQIEFWSYLADWSSKQLGFSQDLTTETNEDVKNREWMKLMNEHSRCKWRYGRRASIYPLANSMMGSCILRFHEFKGKTMNTHLMHKCSMNVWNMYQHVGHSVINLMLINIPYMEHVR